MCLFTFHVCLLDFFTLDLLFTKDKLHIIWWICKTKFPHRGERDTSVASTGSSFVIYELHDLNSIAINLN